MVYHGSISISHAVRKKAVQKFHAYIHATDAYFVWLAYNNKISLCIIYAMTAM